MNKTLAKVYLRLMTCNGRDSMYSYLLECIITKRECELIINEGV